jgi:hypothetical protein
MECASISSKYRDEDSHDRRRSVEELYLQSSQVIKTKKSTIRRLINMFSDEPVNWNIQIETKLCIPATLNG